MNSEYIKALETRAGWLSWGKSKTAQSIWGDMSSIADKNYLRSLPMYVKSLTQGDTFFMNRQFGSLVEHARSSVPDDLVFESSWLESKAGWMWLETPFKVPEFVMDEGTKKLVGKTNIGITISAIGWFPVPEGTKADDSGRVAVSGATQFLCFINFEDIGPLGTDPGISSYGFGCWSHFMLMPGDKLIDRVRQFENMAIRESGSYENSRASEMMHEIRWIYAAFHLMAQRLAHHSKQKPDRATRRRAERNKTVIPPEIRIVSLRKLEEDKKKNPNWFVKDVDWQWQWQVRGHWRNQYYPSENTHRQVFIEAYIKGPEDKPLKPPGHKLFTAVR